MTGRDTLTPKLFTADYIEAMLKLERARCEHCGKSMLSHAARFVREACDRRRSA